ncbi:saccharopine dehydrogenase family protein [Segniliparus rugosus]|uniref:Saccharopine dehydrogenase NADP binding domain-containing protein n=1 Tax=Segniliparus rugosus (strain ATCC BAA-974 / DSM 45345 / CCUG 50838 / CIP 108380 / JCM 13579 / CDC 945) TaxID=679197 RepID=E5XR81_SEGRC|nr:saccharopine dehydrogenase NADP-binding domain-containing protein [Segniliparus rugosus]EFV13174.2 hypothetical protein HMPREF9336_02003 [Segniliparus rugosus ATCC BAA-974]
MAKSTSRSLDIVLYGATGFAGALTAEHLAKNAPPGVRIGLAGRNRAKLESVRANLGSAASEWPIIIADADAPSTLDALAQRTQVVITTVGPYTKYGLPLVGACANVGTDYVDLTGEVLFALDSINKYHEQAVGSGARIVHACGFDSVPSDLSVYLLHRRAQQDEAGELEDTTLVVRAAVGGISGGTAASGLEIIDAARKDPAARRATLDPYTLSPDRAKEPEFGSQSDLAVARGADIDPSVRGWKAPFFMGVFNSRIVRRSNAILDWAYGSRFRYRETMNAGPPLLSIPVSLAIAGGLGFGAVLAAVGLSIPPVRWLIERLSPKSGTGPGEWLRKRGFYTIDTYTRTSNGARYVLTWSQKGDPGYAATAVMLGESALTLALDRDRLPHRAGVLTPATAMGDALADRLRAAGLQIDIRKLG